MKTVGHSQYASLNKSERVIRGEARFFYVENGVIFLFLDEIPRVWRFFQDGDHVGFSSSILKISLIDLVYHFFNVRVC